MHGVVCTACTACDHVCILYVRPVHTLLLGVSEARRSQRSPPCLPFRILSRIILSMEAGAVLVLRSAHIYGAMYGVLNQNYALVGGRRHSRVALGPHSNPLCHVHHDFRCIVLMTPAEVAQADSSLLNRFEKQQVVSEQLLPDGAAAVLPRLRAWVDQMAGLASGQGDNATAAGAGPDAGNDTSSGAGGRQGPAAGAAAAAAAAAVFGVADLFAGFCAATLPALLLHHATAAQQSGGQVTTAAGGSAEALLAACQRSLMLTATADGMARAAASAHPGSAAGQQLAQLAAAYLAAPKHSLQQFVAAELQRWQGQQQQAVSCSSAAAADMEVDESAGAAPQASAADSPGTPGSEQQAAQPVQLWLVTTHSGQQAQLPGLLAGLAAEVREHHLEQFTSEAALQHVLQHFLQGSTQPRAASAASPAAAGGAAASGLRLLVFHARAEHSDAKVQHLQRLVQQQLQQQPQEDSRAQGCARQPTAVCIVLHMQRHLPASMSAQPAAPASHASTAPSAAATAAQAAPAGSRAPVAGGWHASCLSGWQVVHIDSLGGPEANIWALLEVALQAAGGTAMQVDGGSGQQQQEPWQHLPVEQLARAALVPALASLVYPDGVDAAGEQHCGILLQMHHSAMMQNAPCPAHKLWLQAPHVCTNTASIKGRPPFPDTGPPPTWRAGRLQQLHQQLLADKELWQVLLARVGQQVAASSWWSTWQQAVAFSPSRLYSYGTLYDALQVSGCRMPPCETSAFLLPTVGACLWRRQAMLCLLACCMHAGLTWHGMLLGNHSLNFDS